MFLALSADEFRYFQVHFCSSLQKIDKCYQEYFAPIPYPNVHQTMIVIVYLTQQIDIYVVDWKSQIE
jgi:hypothetical protein